MTKEKDHEGPGQDAQGDKSLLKVNSIRHVSCVLNVSLIIAKVIWFLDVSCIGPQEM